jgi:threonine dehydrogenase-like Zn-dependent dehydrogenase
LRLAFDLLSPGGVLSSVGVHTALHYPFSPGEAYDKNLSLRCGRCPVRSLVPWAARILASMHAAGVDVRGLVITHRLALRDAPRAYEAFNAREAGWGKVVLRPW